MKRARSSAFTLIETMAVVVGLSLVLAAVFSTYSTVQAQATVAAEATEGPRRATGLLDRMAREIEATTLIVKPGEVDPLDHPWLFLAEANGPHGADRIRFQTRSHRPSANERHSSDLVDVAWFLAADDDGVGFELWRWSSSQLPERLDRRFPRRDADGVRSLARGLAEFGVRWLAEDGSWVDEWDSSTLVRSSQLPIAAEIRVAFLTEDPTRTPTAYTRHVNLALGPMDLEAELSGGQEPLRSGAGPDDETDETGNPQGSANRGDTPLPGEFPTSDGSAGP